MKTTITVGVFEHTVTVFIYCTGFFIIIFAGLLEIIFIDKIISGIIWWIGCRVLFDTP